MNARTALGRIRHPVRTAKGLVRRLAQGPGLPLGRTAQLRRLLRERLGEPTCALVIGPVPAVRQAFPHALLDVVGTDPHDPLVTVVSEAIGPGSLPQRWDCVVVTDPVPRHERVLAATAACRPGGVVAIARPQSSGPQPGAFQGTTTELVATSRGLSLTILRILA